MSNICVYKNLGTFTKDVLKSPGRTYQANAFKKGQLSLLNKCVCNHAIVVESLPALKQLH